MSSSIELIGFCKLTLRCDRCKLKRIIRHRRTGMSVYDIINVAKREARGLSLIDGWLWRSYGSKGIKHFCPKCAEQPDLAAWKMEKILPGKFRKTAFSE